MIYQVLQLGDLCCGASKVRIYIHTALYKKKKGKKITAAVLLHLPGHQAQTHTYFWVK